MFLLVPSTWQPIASHICYGPKDNAYAKFTFNQQCELVGLRLRHVSGVFKDKYGKGLFGRGAWKFWTLITNSSNSLVYPTNVNDKGRYSLGGFDVTDTLIFFNNFPAIKVTKEEEFRIWFGPDFIDYKYSTTTGPTGSHCVNVDVSCLV